MIENKKQAALDYIKSIHVEYDSDPVIAYCAFGAGAEWMQEKLIDEFFCWLITYSPFIASNIKTAKDDFKKYLER